MKRVAPVTLLLLGLALPAVAQSLPQRPFPVAAAIHPFTQQTYDQWLTKLSEAEAASRPGGDLQKARPVLEANEAWFKEKRQTLARHPQFKAGLVRQLMLRVKLAKITSFAALVVAEQAIKSHNPALFSAKDGAYDQLAKADAWVQALRQDVSDPNQPLITETAAFIDDVRAKTKAKADSLQSGGQNGLPAVSLALPPGTRLHPFTQQTFETWIKNNEADMAVARGNQPLKKKIHELEGGQRFFMSSLQELQKHPSFAQGMAQMDVVLLALGELKAQQAVAFAEEGLKAMNPNMFSESAGTYQQIQEAQRLLDDVSKRKGADDPACRQLAGALDKAKAKVAGIAETYNKKAAASFRLAAEAYRGGDKARLKQLVVAKWKANFPADQILGVRFHKAGWERKREASWNNGSWYFYDNSILPVYVVVKKSAELATVYPAYVRKDNGGGNLTIDAPTVKHASSPHADMLLKNVTF